jgi:hypothetical protein
MAISTSGLSVPQLGQGIDSSIYGNKEAPKGMTLSDLINVSRSNIALQKEKELLQPSIEAGKAQAETAQVQAKKAQLGLQSDFADKMRQNQIALLNNPLIVQAEQDPNFAKSHVQEIHDLINSQKQAAIEMGLDPQKAEQLNAPYHVAVDSSNGQGIRQFLKTRMIAGLDQQAQANMQPTQYFGAAPGAPQTNAPSQAQNVPEYSQPVSAPYAIPQAGQPRSQLPAEEGDRITGERYRQELKPIQTQYAAIRQNYDKLVDQAEVIAGSTIFGGAAGTAERALRAKIGTPEYQQLSKDLANAQIAQIKAQGGSMDTVAGQQLQGYANGSVTYDPKVLIDIARRNAANLENSYSQSFGADKASERFGDANVNRKFRTEWNKNANDNAVFEMKYIFSHAKTPEQGTKAVADYIKQSGLSPEKRKELATKYLNLQKLEKEGSL